MAAVTEVSTPDLDSPSNAHMYTISELLNLRPAKCDKPDGGHLHLEDVPAEEAAALKALNNKRSRQRGPIGPITECVPVDPEVLQRNRGELRRIEQQTGAQIKEKAGLRNYTVIITGTAAIVEQALPLVEQALSEEPGPAPPILSEPPPEPPPAPPAESHSPPKHPPTISQNLSGYPLPITKVKELPPEYRHQDHIVPTVKKAPPPTESLYQHNIAQSVIDAPQPVHPHWDYTAPAGIKAPPPEHRHHDHIVSTVIKSPPPHCYNAPTVNKAPPQAYPLQDHIASPSLTAPTQAYPHEDHIAPAVKAQPRVYPHQDHIAPSAPYRHFAAPGLELEPEPKHPPPAPPAPGLDLAPEPRHPPPAPPAPGLDLDREPKHPTPASQAPGLDLEPEPRHPPPPIPRAAIWDLEPEPPHPPPAPPAPGLNLKPEPTHPPPAPPVPQDPWMPPDDVATALQSPAVHTGNRGFESQLLVEPVEETPNRWRRADTNRRENLHGDTPGVVPASSPTEVAPVSDPWWSPHDPSLPVSDEADEDWEIPPHWRRTGDRQAVNCDAGNVPPDDQFDIAMVDSWSPHSAEAGGSHPSSYSNRDVPPHWTHTGDRQAETGKVPSDEQFDIAVVDPCPTVPSRTTDGPYSAAVEEDTGFWEASPSGSRHLEESHLQPSGHVDEIDAWVAVGQEPLPTRAERHESTEERLPAAWQQEEEEDEQPKEPFGENIPIEDGPTKGAQTDEILGDDKTPDPAGGGDSAKKKKAKKKNKKKKTDETPKAEASNADVQTSPKSTSKSTPKAKALGHLGSKTAFAGLEDSSDSDAQDDAIVKPPPPPAPSGRSKPAASQNKAATKSGKANVVANPPSSATSSASAAPRVPQKAPPEPSVDKSATQIQDTKAKPQPPPPPPIKHVSSPAPKPAPNAVHKGKQPPPTIAVKPPPQAPNAVHKGKQPPPTIAVKPPPPPLAVVESPTSRPPPPPATSVPSTAKASASKPKPYIKPPPQRMPTDPAIDSAPVAKPAPAAVGVWDGGISVNGGTGPLSSTPAIFKSPPAAKPPPPAKVAPKPKPAPSAANPLPQRAAGKARTPKASVMLSGGLSWNTDNNENAASGRKWAERPVEKLDLHNTYYEEEEDPDLACYLWDRRSQRPKNDHARAVAKVAPLPGQGTSTQRMVPPPPQRQRQLLTKVMEMGFDEPSAKRALTATGWAGVEEAIAVLFG